MRINCREPYDFDLSWNAFSGITGPESNREGEMACWVEGRPTCVSLRRHPSRSDIVEVEADPPPGSPAAFSMRMRDVLNADLELQPFYRQASRHAVMRDVARELHGLKPLRPPDLFQMLVIAITEQQISMAAAARIRERLVRRLGSGAGRLVAFPRAEDIAPRGLEELRECGLSRMKAQYLMELSKKVFLGEVDPSSWRKKDARETREELLALKGVGEWTVDYLLVRGLGQTDSVPVGDLGVRRVVGQYLGDGGMMAPGEVGPALEGLSPWKGLAVFYLLVHHRRAAGLGVRHPP